MKVNRVALINILQKRLDALERRAAERFMIGLEKHAERERKYYDETLDAWREFARTITDRVDEKGGFVQSSDIPQRIRSGLGGLFFFTDKKPDAPTATHSERQLARLIEILKNSSDDEVSTYALEKMGFPIGRVLSGLDN